MHNSTVTATNTSDDEKTLNSMDEHSETDSQNAAEETEVMKRGGFMEAEGDPNGNTIPSNGVPRWGPQHAGAQQLAGMYSGGKRLQETISTYTAAVVGLFTVSLILMSVQFQYLPYMFIGFVLAGLAADFFSGLIHWGADSWGSVDMPVIGKSLLRPFREHHIDPTAITRHDFIETSGDLCAIAIPIFGIISYRQYSYADMSLLGLGGVDPALAAQSPEQYGFSFFLFMLAILIVCTNQIHKWSHTYFGLPKWVEFLQWSHLILPKRHHRLHHISPHDTHFCITTGWLNWPLHYIHFWPRLEALITALTGAKPRTDDLAWATKVSIH